MLLEKRKTVDLRKELQYRRSASVRKLYCSKGTDGVKSYPICPTCDVPMEREYQSYCNHCGQKLGWREFQKAVVIVNG